MVRSFKSFDELNKAVLNDIKEKKKTTDNKSHSDTKNHHNKKTIPTISGAKKIERPETRKQRPLKTGIYCPDDGSFLNLGKPVKLTIKNKGSIIITLYYCSDCKRYFTNTDFFTYGKHLKLNEIVVENIGCRVYKKNENQWIDSDTGKTSKEGRPIGVNNYVLSYIREKSGRKVIGIQGDVSKKCRFCGWNLKGKDSETQISLKMLDENEFSFDCRCCPSCGAVFFSDTNRLRSLGCNADYIKEIIFSFPKPYYQKTRTAKKNGTGSHSKTKNVNEINPADPNGKTRTSAAQKEKIVHTNEIVSETPRFKREAIRKYKLDCYYIAEYHPYYTGKQDGFSRMILDFKNERPAAMEAVYNMLKTMIPAGSTLCVIPSSKKGKEGALSKVVAALERDGILTNGRYLKRIESKPSYHMGNVTRNPENEYKTIECGPRSEIEGKDIILIDDICTSGSTLCGCRDLLLKNGARRVICTALGRTV